MVEPSDLNDQNTNIKQGKSQVNFASGWTPNMYPQVAKKSGLREVLNFEFSSRYPNPTKTKGYAPWNSAGNPMTGEGAVFFTEALYGGKGDNDYVIAARPNGNSTARLYSAERTNKKFTTIDNTSTQFARHAIQQTKFQVGSTTWMYLCQGGASSIDYTFKTDGSNVFRAGNKGPSTGFSATKNGSEGGGSINGVTKIRVAYVYGDFGESAAGDSVAIKPNSQNIKLDSLPTLNDSNYPSVTARKIYRTQEKPESTQLLGEYFLAKEIEDNTTSTTTLTTTGAVLIGGQAKPEDNSPIPAAQVVTTYANRVFYAGGDITPGRIIYSKELKPDQWEDPDRSPVPTVIDTIRGSDQTIMAMEGAETKMFIVTANSVWLLSGRTPDNWTFQELHNIGTRSPDSVVEVEGRLYFLGSDLRNVYMTDGRNVQRIGEPIQNYVARADWSKADRFWAIYDSKKDEYRLHFKHRDGKPDTAI